MPADNLLQPSSASLLLIFSLLAFQQSLKKLLDWSVLEDFLSSFSAYPLRCLLRSCNSVLCPHAKRLAATLVCVSHQRFQEQWSHPTCISMPRFPEEIAWHWITCIPARGTTRGCKDGLGFYCLWASHTALARSTVLESSPSLWTAKSLLAALN